MIGDVGTAQTALSPRGKVSIHGELWDAVASADVAAGQAVVVRHLDGLELQVEPTTSFDRTPAPATW
jgi:membrane-bound serine protease (ClpP class)